MKARLLRDKSVEELRVELVSLLKAQFSARIQHATRQLANTSQLKKLRVDVARVLTVLAEKAK